MCDNIRVNKRGNYWIIIIYLFLLTAMCDNIRMNKRGNYWRIIIYLFLFTAMCDNITMNKRGNYWIASTLMHNEDLDRYEHDPSALQLMAGVVPYSTIL